jgi:hypothetical protein
MKGAGGVATPDRGDLQEQLIPAFDELQRGTLLKRVS